jgi:four helix bundle protein
MKTDNVIVTKSKAFALKIIQLFKFLQAEKREFILSKQILRSGTSIGANIKEAIRGQSKPDFYAKLFISLKEASETEYWLELLHESYYITDEQFNKLYPDCEELLRLLMAITKHRPPQHRHFLWRSSPKNYPFH